MLDWRIRPLAAAALATFGLAGCSVLGLGNRPPVAVGEIRPMTLDESARQVDLSRYFRDPDGDSLTFVGRAEPSHVLSVSVTGNILTIRARRFAETATVIATASDPGGGTAEQRFAVQTPVGPQLRPPPFPSTPIPATQVVLGQTVTVDLSQHFTYGQPRHFRAESSAPEIVRVWVSQAILSLEGRALGASRVTVTVDDWATQTFSVEVIP